MRAGARGGGRSAVSAVSPFWRVVEPEGSLAQKLSCGPEFIAAQRALEAGDKPVKTPKKKAAAA
jgi:hypothetical protein